MNQNELGQEGENVQDFVPIVMDSMSDQTLLVLFKNNQDLEHRRS